MYPQSRVVRQRLARERQAAAERRRRQLIDQLARDEAEKQHLSDLTLAELICKKNVQPNLFD